MRRFALWVPVFLAVGIALYFELENEPSLAWGVAPVIGFIAVRLARGRLLALALAGVMATSALGFTSAMLHAHYVRAPILSGSIDETVEGRVIERSRSQSGQPRVLLDRLVIYGLDARETPARVRITLREDDVAPLPGQALRVYARVSPPAGPVEPGGFDFRRRAYFERLGGVGFARGIAIPLGAAPIEGTWDRAFLWVAERRARIADSLRAAMPGSEGAVAAAIIVGDRSAIDPADAEALRISNLAHLLAISGLHMGILTGLIFFGLRTGMALLPVFALNLPSKKIAAVVALAAGLGYQAFSGGTIATQRAFIMVAVALTAVLLDRPALTLRSVALAACLILVWRPVSLLDVGFQMSFAATTALVAGFSGLRQVLPWMQAPPVGIKNRLIGYASGLFLTSVLAGAATAPFAAYHFNRVGPYGLLANLVAVPAMGL
ncbi:MAG: ComEC/Rec2 family competence protein, partial [Pseudomonadota bacterium]